MKWKELLKNIQISSQGAKQKDIVLPPEEEEDNDCYERYLKMIDTLSAPSGNIRFNNTRGNLLEVPYDDEAYCWFLGRLNQALFIYYFDGLDMNNRARMGVNEAYTQQINGESYRCEFTLFFDSAFYGPLRECDGTIYARFYKVDDELHRRLGEYIITNFEFKPTERDMEIINNLEPYDDDVRTVALKAEELPESLKNLWGNF